VQPARVGFFSERVEVVFQREKDAGAKGLTWSALVHDPLSLGELAHLFGDSSYILRLQSLVYEKGFEAAVDVDRGDGCSCHLLRSSMHPRI
jgi:hypothetical protein